MNGVKNHWWRTRGYQLWKKQFGAATWRDEKKAEEEEQKDAEKEENGESDLEMVGGGRDWDGMKRKHEDQYKHQAKRPKRENDRWDSSICSPTPTRTLRFGGVLLEGLGRASPGRLEHAPPPRPANPAPRLRRYAPSLAAGNADA